MAKVLVTFDIDGTILYSVPGSVQHSVAIQRVANELYGVPYDIPIRDYCNSNFSGTTDSWIARVIIQKATNKENVTQEELDNFEKAEVEVFHKYYPGEHYALEGVYDAIKQISEMENVTIALCTGNYEKIAWTKVSHVGVDKFFEGHLGGFGNIEDRKEILKTAIKNAEKAKGYKFDRIIHIGDAVQDINAANEAGVIAVGVETGHLKKADFPKPCFVISNMKDGFDDLVSIIQAGKPIHKECEHF